MKKTGTQQEKIFIGVSWPYANGNIHLGHLAGQYVVCDVFARYHRLKGNRVLMVSGSDSHGAPVVFKAEELGIEPAIFAQQAHETIVDTYNKLGFIYENYTKTTTENHKKVAQNIFLVLKERGYLHIKESNQYYDEKAGRFLPDRYVRGTCPNCGAKNARGDECPECGKYLEPEQLIDPYSTLSDSKPVMKKTEHFYMDLTALQNRLKEWIEKNSAHWRKWVREFSLGWIRQGLEERPVTRDMNFGIQVPVKGWENKVLYVWIEAVVGYLSAAIEWAEKSGDPSAWEQFWKDPNTKHYYFIAGGNVPFHTIMWPGEIIAYNEKYTDQNLWEQYKLPGETENKPLNLPYDVPANNMLFYKGKKMSKGDGTGITVEKALELFGPDSMRFYYVRNAPENQDRDYIWKDFIDTNNNELVANIGNFINRSLTFLWTKYAGVVPEGNLEPEVAAAIEKAFIKVGSYLEQAKFVKAAQALLKLGDFANKYFNDKKPWESIKSDGNTTGQTIYNTVQLANAFRILLKPFTPFAVEKFNEILGVTNEYDPSSLVAAGKYDHLTYENLWKFNEISVGHKIAEPKILFGKLEYTEELQEQDR